MRRIGSVLIVLATCGPLASADWWYTYEADGTYPEQEGWERNIMGGGAQRWFEDGAFVLDASATPAICDFYGKGMPSLPDPNEPTHPFVCEWRLRVQTVSGFWNPEMFAAFQGYGDIALEYKMDRIYSLHEGKYVADFEPGVFHSYTVVTSDMDSYTLAIDGTVVYTGEVSPWAPWSAVQFGDATTGSASLSRWDYLRYGVIAVPEPGSILLCATAVLGLGSRLRRRTR
jgi:hypothetical protein